MHVFEVTKYHPDHFDNRGYFGPEEEKSSVRAGITLRTALTVWLALNDEDRPLAEAVLPDDDGVVRVRWSV